MPSHCSHSKIIHSKKYDWLNYGPKQSNNKHPMVCSICYGKPKSDKISFSSVHLRQMATRELDKHENSSEHQSNKAASTSSMLTIDVMHVNKKLIVKGLATTAVVTVRNFRKSTTKSHSGGRWTREQRESPSS